MTEYRGQCLCGAVRYVITAEAPEAMFLCHCSRCRKETGTIHCANVFFADAAELEWERGGDELSFYALEGTRKQRWFCRNCGSPMPGRYPSGRVGLPAGSLDDSSLVEPTAHIFCASSAAWADDVAELARFDEFPG